MTKPSSRLPTGQSGSTARRGRAVGCHCHVQLITGHCGLILSTDSEVDDSHLLSRLRRPGALPPPSHTLPFCGHSTNNTTLLHTYIFMAKHPFSEANIFSVSKEIPPPHFIKPDSLLPYSKYPPLVPIPSQINPRPSKSFLSDIF